MPSPEPLDGGFAERARARIRYGALYGPPGHRYEIEQLPRERTEPHAGAERGHDLRQALAVYLLAVGGGDPQHEAHLVQGQHG